MSGDCRSCFAVRAIVVSLFGVMCASSQEAGEASKGKPPAAERVATATVRILHFDKQVPPGRMAVSAGVGAGEGPARVVARYGEDVTFSWTIQACGARSLNASLNPGGAVEAGTARDEGGGCFTYRNAKTLTVTAAGPIALRVAATPAGPASSASKSVEVVLQRYGLEIADVTLEQDTRKVTFYARNTGEVDIPAGEIQVLYRITAVGEGHSQETLFNDWINRRDVPVPRGERVEFGVLHLPERATYYHHFTVNTEVYGERFGFPNKRQQFSLGWQPHESRINRLLLETLVGAIVGDVRFNNYDPAKRTAEEISVAPFKRDDSWVTLLGEPMYFTPSPISMHFAVRTQWGGREVYGLDLRAFINNIGVGSNRPELRLGTNLLGVRLTFNTAGSREVKIFAYYPDEGIYNDNMGPDLEFSELAVDLTLNVGWGERNVFVRRINSRTRVSSAFAGGWGVLDEIAPSVQERVEREIRSAVDREVLGRLNNEATLARINEQLARLVNALHITRIESVRLDDDGILVRYF